MTRVLITGAGGMLGRDLVSVFSSDDVSQATRAELDITDWHQVQEAVAGHDVVINAAAYTAVDDAEGHEDEAFAVNAEGPRLLARASQASGAKLIHVSTDYVFDGHARSPYAEDTPRHPVSAYGRSKGAGEEATEQEYPHGSIIIRTAWLYGAHGPNFPKTMLTAAATRDTLQVVDDQVGQPTWSKDLAGWIHTLAHSDIRRGVFHGTNAGQASWFEFAREVFRLAGLDPERIQPTTSDQFPRPAVRPAWSVLGHEAWDRARLARPRPWQDALAEAFPECFAGLV